jgi:hypothetical protein
MVEMQVAEQDVDGVGRRIAEICAQRGEARSGIDDEEALAAADFNARGVTAELDELRTGRAGRTSDPPESDLELAGG